MIEVKEVIDAINDVSDEKVQKALSRLAALAMEAYNRGNTAIKIIDGFIALDEIRAQKAGSLLSIMLELEKQRDGGTAQ